MSKIKEKRKRKSSAQCFEDDVKSKKIGYQEINGEMNTTEGGSPRKEVDIDDDGYLFDNSECSNNKSEAKSIPKDEEEKEIRFSTNFDMKAFRSKLRGNNFIVDLRHFLHLHNQGKHIVGKYLEKKGTALEIVDAFKRIDSTNAYQASYVAEAFRLILEHIATTQPDETEAAAETCRFFMKTHSNLLRILLKSGNAEHRKVGICLMTVISVLAPNTIRNLLNCFDEFKNKKEMTTCISRSGDGVSVRDVFLRFVLSLLVDGTTSTVKVLLDKYEVVGEALSGLTYDDHEMVVSVLTALRKCVLESLLISKTKKVRIFDIRNVQRVMALYEWKGPAFLDATKHTQKPDPEKFIDKQKQNAVRLCANDFLILLLSNRKYGVAFDAMTSLHQKKNETQQKALFFLTAPYTDPLKKQLVFKILVACPELAEGMIRNLSSKIKNPNELYSRGALNPVDEKEIVFKILEFISEIVAELNPTVMRSGLDQISLSRFTRWMKELCLPLKVLEMLSKPALIHSQVTARRLLTTKMLSTLFQQYCNYMVAIIQREKFKGNDLRKFRLEMLDYLFLHFPRTDDILLSLYISARESADKEILMEHMNYTFDLLISICKANRSFVEKTFVVVQYINLLYPTFQSTTDKKAVAILVKGIKLLLMLQPSVLLPKANKNSQMLENLCYFFMNDINNELNIAPILQQLFLNSNVFSNGLLEIDIWLEAIKFIEKDNSSELARCWTTILSAEKCNIKSYQKIEYASGSNAKMLFSDIEKGNTTNGYMDIPTLSDPLVYIMERSPDFPKCNEYFELVSFFLFHFIPAPRDLLEIYSSQYTKYYKYMLSWVEKEKPGKLKVTSIPGFNEMYSSLLEGRLDFTVVFKGTEKIFVGDNELDLNPHLKRSTYVMILIYQICFVISQLAEKLNLELIQVNAATHYLTHLLYILSTNIGQKNNIVLDGKEKDETEASYVEQALKYIYCRYLPLLKAFNIFGKVTSEKNFLKFICSLTEVANKLKINDLKNITVNYRSKIVSQITTAIEETLKTKTIPLSESILSLLETFQMSHENCLQLLLQLSRLKAKYYIVDIHNRSVYYDVLAIILNRLSELRKSAQDKALILKIVNIYVKLVTSIKVEFGLDKLEQSLYNFLRVSHNCIEIVPKDVFKAVFENVRVSKSTIKFACLLAERREDFRQEFISIVPKQLSKKELVYPLLNVLILSGSDIDLGVLQNIYKEYKNGIIKAIEKPQKVAVIYKENIEASIYLIEKCMLKTEFHRKTLKSDSVEVFQLQLLDAIYRKEMQYHMDNAKSYGETFVSFINCFTQHLLVILKREPLDAYKVSSACYSLYNWIESFGKLEYDKAAIVDTAQWPSFCKSCLKYGMRALEENGQAVIGSDDNINSFFLKLLAYLFEKFYDDDINSMQASVLFDMITSHSRFFEIVLMKNQSHVKTQLMHLILVLVQKNHSIMDEKHVPLLLGAYHAKLSICDRFTLAILQFYEKNGVNFSKYKPFIWGEYAIEQYSLKTHDDQPIILQELSITQLMSIVDRYTSEFTVTNFPVWRCLDTLAQLPVTKFENPHIDSKQFGSLELEQRIESGQTKFDNSFLRLLPVAQETYDNCYDPAFTIPLLVGALAPGTYLHPVKPVQNGLLGIAFAALSSMDTNMRLAAGIAHLRYREHFQTNKFLDKPLWNQAYDNVQTGLAALHNRWSKHKKALVPRVPYVSGLFLSISMTTLVDPLDPMYKVLSMYLRVKSTFDFLCVPEFHVLFHSPEIDHLSNRQFILNVIRNGIKCSSDLFLLVTTGTFKALMGFYGTPMSTSDINLRILSIINVCVKIPASVKLMIEHIGIITWLNSVIDSTEFFYFDTIEGIINIISNLWHALKAAESCPRSLTYAELRIFRLLVKLTPLISNRLSLKCLGKYLNIILKTANGHHKAINEVLLDHIVSCTRRHFSDHLWYIDNVREFGVKCIESSSAFLKEMKDSKLDDEQLLALLSLRNFVVKWKELAT